MSMRDPETGQFVSDDGTDVDYSDFEYQTVLIENILNPEGEANPRGLYSAVIEPLDAIGGLDTNEVAELVYYELQVDIEPEGEGGGDQTRSTAVEHRGVFGANLPEGGTMDFNGDEPNLTTIDSADPVQIRGSSTGSTEINGANEDGLFQQFAARGVYPFDDSGLETTQTGVSGGNVNNPLVYERNYRSLTGRGPVLDANDDIVVNAVLVGSDLISNVIGTVRLHLVWDTAEVDDAGRAFSVPMDD